MQPVSKDSDIDNLEITVLLCYPQIRWMKFRQCTSVPCTFYSASKICSHARWTFCVHHLKLYTGFWSQSVLPYVV